jgi:putative ABC transport system permease protein
MSVWRLSWQYLWARPGRTWANLVALTLALTAMLVVLSLNDQIRHNFERQLKGIDAVVGAKGSPIQLMLSGVYHLDMPTGNIPLKAFEQLRTHPQVARAIPLSLGDNVAGYRIVGTEPSYLQLYGAQLAQGRMWQSNMEAVIGTQVHEQTRLKLGDTFVGVHGLGAGGEAHDDTPYTVTGIMAPCHCILDRLVLTSTKSVWQVHDDIHGLEGLTESERQSLDEEREVTLALVTYNTPLASLTFVRFVNQTTAMQAASPAIEMTRLLTLVGAGSRLLEGFIAALLLLAGLSIATSFSAAVSERQADLALLRMLGAPPQRLVHLLLAESAWLTLMGLVAAAALSQTVLAVLQMLLPGGAVPLWQAGVMSPSLLWLPAIVLGLMALAVALPIWRALKLDVLLLLKRN